MTTLRNRRVYQTKKNLAGGSRNYRPWKEWEVGDQVVAKFTGTQEDNYGHTNTVCEVLDAQFEDADLAESLIGKTLVLNACGSLNKARELMDEGVTVFQVTYNGKALMTKGNFAGKEAHSIEVSEVDFDGGSDATSQL